MSQRIAPRMNIPRRAIDLPTLLALTSAQQAVTPTAQAQARLTMNPKAQEILSDTAGSGTIRQRTCFNSEAAKSLMAAAKIKSSVNL